ncbi:MAG: hypothetical protein OEY43_09115 [Gammaproteobacteria bacterium]|nr:hypothetical protein [Gammaproteobacteria bacterium]
MIDGLKDLSETDLKQWIENSLAEKSHILAAGVQGQTLKYQDQQNSLVIKTPHGRGLIKYFHILMLRHEYAVYKKLQDYSFAPRCYGLLAGRYLVIEYIDAKPIRHARPQNELLFFQQLFTAIQQLHEIGIAHFDLKKKDNLLVINGERPCLIDFGTAVIRKTGCCAIFNHFWYRLAKQFDYNAWIKYKYKKQLELISAGDRPYYHRTIIEIVSRKLKRFYKDNIYDKRKAGKK